MIKRSLFPGFLLFLFLFFSGCYRPEPRQSMNDLHRIAGSWSSQKIQFFEIWEMISDTLMEGLGYSLQNSDTVFSETMKFYYENGKVFLAVKQEGEKEFTLFKLKEAERNRWVFENKENEYPNLITYEVSDDELHAAVMNSRGNKKIEFNMKRR